MFQVMELSSIVEVRELSDPIALRHLATFAMR